MLAAVAGRAGPGGAIGKTLFIGLTNVVFTVALTGPAASNHNET